MSGISGHTVSAAAISATPRAYGIVLDEGERASLAAAFKLPAIGALAGHFTLSLLRGGIIGARLHVTARVTQDCVVTMEPVESAIDEAVTLRFVPEDEAAAPEAMDDLEAPDEIAYAGGVIDLGAALAEQLALSLDPYPRRPGAAFENPEDEAAHPFAALRRLKAGDDAG